MPDLAALIARAEAVEKEATEGPWHSYACGPNSFVEGIERVDGTSVLDSPEGLRDQDADLITFLRNCAPELLAAIKTGHVLDEAYRNPNWPGWATSAGWDEAWTDFSSALDALTSALVRELGDG